MDRNQILDLFRSLACSTGLYGRILRDIMEMDEDAREEYLSFLESLNFATDLEVVLFIEEGKYPDSYPASELGEDEDEPAQVTLTITTDLYHTADFLRELAAAIEDEGTDMEGYETAHGLASVDWPDEAYEDEEE